MEQVKPRLLLVVPMLHQGGFERVCVRTARILRNDFEVTIAMFSDADIAYDINGLSVVNLDVPAQDGKLKKMVNVVKRTVRLRKLKKKLRPDLTYSFGPTANLINVLTPVRGQIWTGIRSYMDMDNPSKLKLFAKRSDQVICCSEVIAHELKEKLGIENTEVLYNPYDGSQIAENAAKNINNVNMSVLSMGMTGDYQVAVQEGSTMVRVGTGIFGERNYATRQED